MSGTRVWSWTLVFLLATSLASAGEPSIQQVDPSQGYVDEETEIILTGDGFEPLAHAALLSGGPYLAGDLDTPGHASGVAVSGDHAYVADGDAGLQVIDVGDPGHPFHVRSIGTPGPAVDVASTGRLLLIAAALAGGGRVEVFDIGDPTNPLPLGACDLPGRPTTIAVQADYAFVLSRVEVNGSPRVHLQVVDLTTPALPTPEGSLIFEGSAEDLAVSGAQVYVAAGHAGLRIIGIADLSHPQTLGSLPTAGTALGVAISGDYALVAGSERLELIDVTDPSAPSLAGSAEVPGAAVMAAGPFAHVSGSGYLQIVDVHDPLHPALPGRVEVPGTGESMMTSEGFVLVAGGDAGLQVVDVADPAGPDPLLGQLSFPGFNLLVQGSTASMTDPFGGLPMIDLTDAANPSLAGYHPPIFFIDSLSGPVGPARLGDHLYLGRWWEEGCGGGLCFPPGSSLKVFNIGNPSQPVLTHFQFFDTSHIRGMAVSEDRLLMALHHPALDLLMYNLTDPAHPQPLGSWTILPPGVSPLDLAALGPYALLAVREDSSATCRLEVIDTGAPGGPAPVGGLVIPACPLPVPGLKPLTMTGETALITGLLPGMAGSWLGVIDLQDPEDPSLVGEYLLPGISRGVAILDDLAAVLTDTELFILDTSEPERPLPAGRYGLDSPGRGVALVENRAFIAGDLFQILQLNPPLTEVQAPSPQMLMAQVPAGFLPGPYDVLVANNAEESTSLRNGYHACPRRELRATLEPVSTATGSGISLPLRWVLTLDGDAAFFEPVPTHEGHLLLPDLPGDLETRYVPGGTPGRATIELHLFPRLDRGVVRLIGPEPAPLSALWEEIRRDGGLGLPPLGARRYGEFTAWIDRTGSPAVDGWLTTSDSIGDMVASAPVRYGYELSDGLLTEAWGRGPGADLLFRALARYVGGCRAGETAGYRDSVHALCEEFAAEHPELALLCGSQPISNPVDPRGGVLPGRRRGRKGITVPGTGAPALPHGQETGSCTVQADEPGGRSDPSPLRP